MKYQLTIILEVDYDDGVERTPAQINHDRGELRHKAKALAIRGGIAAYGAIKEAKHVSDLEVTDAFAEEAA